MMSVAILPNHNKINKVYNTANIYYGLVKIHIFAAIICKMNSNRNFKIMVCSHEQVLVAICNTHTIMLFLVKVPIFNTYIVA